MAGPPSGFTPSSGPRAVVQLGRGAWPPRWCACRPGAGGCRGSWQGRLPGRQALLAPRLASSPAPRLLTCHPK